MSTTEEKNKELVRSFLARLDGGDRSVIRKVYFPDVVLHFPGGPPMDIEATVQMVDTMYTAFPDFTHNIDDLLAVGDKVVLRATDVGTHRGEYEGIPPTGKQVTVTVIAILKIVGDQIVEVWEEVDMLGFMKQLGLELKPSG
jgi:predicted ester cyclase